MGVLLRRHLPFPFSLLCRCKEGAFSSDEPLCMVVYDEPHSSPLAECLCSTSVYTAYFGSKRLCIVLRCNGSYISM